MELLLLIGLCYGVVCGFCTACLTSGRPWVWAAPPLLLLALAGLPFPGSLLAGLLPPLLLLGVTVTRGGDEKSMHAVHALVFTGILFAGMITLADQTGGISAPFLGAVVGLSAGLLGNTQARNPVTLGKEVAPTFWWVASIFFGMLTFSLGALADLQFALVSVAAYALCVWLGRNRLLVRPRHP